MYKIAFNEMEWDISPEDVRSKTYQEESRQFRLIEFGRELNHPQWCTTGHIGYVLDGEVEIEFEDKTIRLRQGDGLSIPAGEKDKHRPKAVSEMVRMFFVEDV